MPILDNPKWEAFCQFRAGGKSLEESFRLAGFKPHRSNAARLSTNDIVVARLKELQQAVAVIYEVTAELIAAQLDEDRALAYENDNPSAAVAATMGKAKLFGLLTDQSSINISHSYASMTEEELRFELAALNAEALALKPGQQH